MRNPKISFVIPAYNAAKTLEECVESLAAQTEISWEAIICDDGSSDNTFDLAALIAARDERVKVVRQENAGASAARNTAARYASADYICMLDSDDWLDPDFLEIMWPVAHSANGSAIAYCSYSYATQDKKPLYIDWAPDLSGEKARLILSEECPIAIHCAIVPRKAYFDVGGMNEQLATCEDWELWMKLAFAGITYREVKRSLGFYRQHSGTLSGNPGNLVRDAIDVVKLARSYLVRDFGARYEADKDMDREMRIATWYTALFAARGVDPHVLFKYVPNPHIFFDGEEETAELVVGGLIEGGLGCSKASLIQTRANWIQAIDEMLTILEGSSLAGFKRRVWSEIARKLQHNSGFATPWQVGNVVVSLVEIGNLKTIVKPMTADVAIVQFTKSGKNAGMQEVPLYSDLSPLDLEWIAARNIHPRTWLWMYDVKIYKPLAKSIYSKRRMLTHSLLNGKTKKRALKDFLEEVLGNVPVTQVRETDSTKIFDHIVENALDVRTIPVLAEVTRGAHREAQINAASEGATEKPEFWEDFFETEDPWDYLSAYETKKYEQTLELIPSHVETALEIACAEGIFTKRLSERVTNLTATDISTKALARARLRCDQESGITFRQLDLKNDNLPINLDLIVCSEVLYYLNDEEDLEKVARKCFDALVPGGLFVTAHAHLLTDEPNRTGFDWGDPYGVGTIRDVFAAIPGFHLEETVETELYAIHRFRKAGRDQVTVPTVRAAEFGKPLLPSVSKYVVWGGVTTSRSKAWNSESTDTVPVLMYHRVSKDAPDGLKDYQVTPEEFEQQLIHLRREGFYGITSSWLSKNIRSGRSFKGRPVLITFDDGYQDFNDFAYPLLQQYNFAAEVFLVTDKIGQTADWDSRFGAPAKLMDWETIGKLRGEDVRFGSHLCSHRPASSLTSEQLLYEAARSKAVLEKAFDTEITSIALPYGDFDRRVTQVLRRVGYEIAFSTDIGDAKPGVSMMRVPRHNIGSFVTLEDFARILARGHS